MKIQGMPEDVVRAAETLSEWLYAHHRRKEEREGLSFELPSPGIRFERDKHGAQAVLYGIGGEAGALLGRVAPEDIERNELDGSLQRIRAAIWKSNSDAVLVLAVRPVVEQEIERATLKERERCAKISEAFVCGEFECCDSESRIAAKIRSGE